MPPSWSPEPLLAVLDRATPRWWKVWERPATNDELRVALDLLRSRALGPSRPLPLRAVGSVERREAQGPQSRCEVVLDGGHVARAGGEEAGKAGRRVVAAELEDLGRVVLAERRGQRRRQRQL